MRKLTPNTEMYDITDVVLKYLIREYVEMFGNFKSSLMQYDELNRQANALYLVDKLYADMTYKLKEKMLELAQLQFDYIQMDDYDEYMITNAWLEELFENYNDTTKYVYANEIERKKQYLYEALMSGRTPVSDIQKAMRLWCLMVGQIAIDVTDKATITAYKENETKRVKWITEHDARRCDKCAKMDGKTYDINKIPPKPHPKCRCFTIPV